MTIRRGYDVLVTAGGTGGTATQLIAAQRNVVFDVKQELNDITTKNDGLNYGDSMRRYEAGRAEFSFTVEALLDTVASRSMWQQDHFGDQWVRNLAPAGGELNKFIRCWRRDGTDHSAASTKVETCRARLSNITEMFGAQETGHYSLTFSLINDDQGVPETSNEAHLMAGIWTVA